jgi:hypothetical protein
MAPEDERWLVAASRDGHDVTDHPSLTLKTSPWTVERFYTTWSKQTNYFWTLTPEGMILAQALARTPEHRVEPSRKELSCNHQYSSNGFGEYKCVMCGKLGRRGEDMA